MYSVQRWDFGFSSRCSATHTHTHKRNKSLTIDCVVQKRNKLKDANQTASAVGLLYSMSDSTGLKENPWELTEIPFNNNSQSHVVRASQSFPGVPVGDYFSLFFSDCNNVHLSNPKMMSAEKFVRVENGEYCKLKEPDSNGRSDVLTQLEPNPGSPTEQNVHMHWNEIQKI